MVCKAAAKYAISDLRRMEEVVSRPLRKGNKIMLVSELLYENILVEKLGNLRSLNVGSMINILKQGKTYHRSHGSGHYFSAREAGTRFGGGVRGEGRNQLDISEASKIVDVGVIKGGIGGLRKAYKEHPDADAFALDVNGKAVCFGTFTSETLAGASRTGLFAFDISQFKDKIEKNYTEKRAKASDWDRKYGDMKDEKSDTKLSSYSEEGPDSWDVRRAEEKGKPKPKNKIFHGQAKDTGSLRAFLEELIQLADGEPITCKLVVTDPNLRSKRSKRAHYKMTGDEIYSGVEALKIRLAKYKISKKPSVDNIEDFIKMTLNKNVKVIQFGGKGWMTTPTSSEKLNAIDILNGDSFD